MDVDAQELDVQLAGWVQFFAPVMDGSPALDLTVANPRVEITGTTGTLYLDVDSLPFGEDTPIVAEGVAFAVIDLAGFYEASEPLGAFTLVLGLEDAEVEVPDNGGGTTPEAEADTEETDSDEEVSGAPRTTPRTRRPCP